MLVGIGFLTVITAAITSTFVSRTEGERALVRLRGCDGGEQLRGIDDRLARIEAALPRSP